jgi:hypothetical protein
MLHRSPLQKIPPTATKITKKTDIIDIEDYDLEDSSNFLEEDPDD